MVTYGVKRFCATEFVSKQKKMALQRVSCVREYIGATTILLSPRARDIIMPATFRKRFLSGERLLGNGASQLLQQMQA
ncbi:hypothetical protein UC8_51580 [Roseimaritima ulvae]|uniref:Uncharacterized protein n=1 Tax=Roseimaritima ulvae TaxID=980254 RepID=A0A5B9QVP7_9BACT|nr:hypothetical protein UC8_51580 [Roseimaritima ulvae]